MKKSALLVVGVPLAFIALMSSLLLVIIGSDDETDCAPLTSTPGGADLPPGSKAMPMKAGSFTISDVFGSRSGGHKGVDMAADDGTSIYSAGDGKVVAAGSASGFGHWIVVDHNIGGSVVSTVYGHMWESGVLVSTGDTVRAGQEIGRVGSDGESSGPHLHFEVVPGGRFSGGDQIDPLPWLQGAAEPGGGSTQSPSPTPAPAPAPDVSVAGGELPALPASKGSEEHWQVDTVRLARSIAVTFPEIQTIGGWRPSDPYPDHPSGRAADIMIPDYQTGAGKALGDRVAAYVLANAQAFHVEYIIWRQTYIPVGGEPNTMEDRGGDTANHYDHVHVTVAGGGYPNGDTRIGPAPAEGATPKPGCAPQPDEHSELAPGTVPPELEPWYRKAGALCPDITAPLLAAQGKQESGFDTRAQSPAGAQGVAQFLPGTATATASDGQPYVLDADGNGTASVWDAGDAIIGQGRYMCDIANKVRGWVDQGKVSAPNGIAELTLAGYNAGEGAVLSSGGFPTGHSDYVTQTRPYVDKILATEREFSRTLT